MKTTTLVIGLFFCPLGAAAQSSTTTVTAPPAQDTTAAAELCQKGCMAHHDSSVVSCKLFKGADRQASCIKSADQKRDVCDQECARRHPARGRPAPKRAPKR